MNFSKVGTSDKVECFALVKHAEVKTSVKGQKYLDIMLSDKSGEINGKYWDYQEGSTPEFPDGSIIKVRGTVNEYRGQKQLRIELIRPALRTDNVDVSELVASSEYDAEAMYEEIRAIAHRFEDDDLRNLVLACYDKYRKELLLYPAAVSMHHAMRSGLLYHTLSIIRMCEAAAAVYPSIDRDLLIAGAALHDLGKIVEMDAGKLGLASQYTTDGNLIGHLVRGAMMVEEVGRDIGTPEDKLLLIEHMLISHHGKPEYGAAIPPKFLEAVVLSKMDELDATVFEVESAVQGLEPDTFTQPIRAMDFTRLYNPGRKEIRPTADLLEETDQ